MLEIPFSTRSELPGGFQDDVDDSSNPKVIVLKIDPFIPDDVSAVEEVFVDANVSPSKFAAEFVQQNASHHTQYFYQQYNTESYSEPKSQIFPARNLFSGDDDAISRQKQKLFACKPCNRSFSTKFSLFQHSRRHTKNAVKIEKPNGDSNLEESEYQVDSKIPRLDLEPNVVHCSADTRVAERESIEELREQNDSPHLVIENVRTVTAESEIDLFENEKQSSNVKTKSKGRRVKHTPSRSTRSTVKDVSNSSKAKLTSLPLKTARRRSSSKNTAPDNGTDENGSEITKTKNKTKKSDLPAISEVVKSEVTDAIAGSRRQRKRNSKYDDFEMIEVFKEESDVNHDQENCVNNEKKGKSKKEIRKDAETYPKKYDVANVENNVTISRPLADNNLSGNAHSPDEAENRCYVCSKTFSRKTALSSHLQIHALSEKPIPRYMLSKEIPVRYSDNIEETDHFDPIKMEENVNSSSKKSGRIRKSTEKGKYLKLNQELLLDESQNQGSSTIDQTMEEVIRQIMNNEVSLAIPSMPIKVLKFPDLRKNRVNKVDLSTLVCSICKLRFTVKKQLNEHYVNEHDVKPHLCTVCFTRFTESSNLRSHMLIHRGIQPYACYICSRKFRAASNVRRHLLTHQEREKVPCPTCGVKFASLSSMEAHVKKHQGGAIYKCEYCPAKFVYVSRLKVHSLKHTNIRAHKCKICAKAYKIKAHLKTHMASHSQVRDFICYYCEAAFYTKGNLLMHIEFKHLKALLESKSETPFSCKYCSQKFAIKGSLRNHEIYHERKHRIKCKLCPAAFISTSKLRRHRALVHTGSRKYKCGSCASSFKAKGNLARHMLMHHRKTRKSKKDK